MSTPHPNTILLGILEKNAEVGAMAVHMKDELLSIARENELLSEQVEKLQAKLDELNAGTETNEHPEQ